MSDVDPQSKDRAAEDVEMVSDNIEEQPGDMVDVDAVEAVVERGLDTVASSATDFLSRQDISEEEREDMEDVVVEAENLRKSFLKRMGDILRHPVLEFRKDRENKLERELAIPDNPKIISMIVGGLLKLSEQILKKEQKQKTGSILSQGQVDEYLQIVNLSSRSQKSDEEKWRGIERDKDYLVRKIITELLKDGDFEGLLPVYDACEGGALEDEIVDKFFDNYDYFDFSRSKEIDLDLIEDKRKILQKMDSDSSDMFVGRDKLLKRKNRRLGVVKRGLASPAELRVINLSDEDFEKLKSLPDDAREKAIVVVQNGGDVKRILDNKDGERLLSFYEIFSSDVVEYSEDDNGEILKIVDKYPDLEKLKQYWILIRDKFVTKNKYSMEGGMQLDMLKTLLDLTASKDGEQKLQEIDFDTASSLTASRMSYGEGNVSVSDIDTNFIFRGQGEKALEFVRQYGDSLSRHLRGTHYAHEKDLSSMNDELLLWEVELEKIPESLRVSLLDSMKESGVRRSHDLGLEKLDEGQIQNFVQYNKTCPKEYKMTIKDLAENSEDFANEGWEKIKINLEKYLENPVKNISKSTGKSFFSLLKNYNDRAEELVSVFDETGPKFSNMIKSRRDWEDAEFERSLNSVHDIHRMVGFVQENFSSVDDLNFKFFAAFDLLDDNRKKILELVLNGSGNLESGVLDLPIVEGLCVDLNSIFANINNNEAFEYFKNLPKEQKTDYLALKDLGLSLGDVLLVLESGKKKEMIDLMSVMGKTFNARNLLLMAERPDCLGLFFYLPQGSYNIQEELDILISWHDLGLSSSYDLTAESFKELVGSDQVWWEHLKKIDAEKFVRILNQVAQEKPGDTLLDLFSVTLNIEEVDEDILMSMVRLYGITNNKNFFHYDNEEAYPDELLQNLESYKDDVRVILDRELTEDETKRLFRGEYRALPEDVVKYLQDKKNILEMYLVSESGIIFSSELLQLGDDILADEKFWKSGIGSNSELLTDAEEVRRFLVLKEKVDNSLFDLRMAGAETIEDLDQIESALGVLEKVSFSGGDKRTIYLLHFESLIKKYSSEQLVDYLNFVFSTIDSDGLESEIKYVATLDGEQRGVISGLQKEIGSLLPFDMLKEHHDIIFSGDSSADVVQAIDKFYGEQYQSGHEEWRSCRRKGLVSNVKDGVSDACDGLLREYLGGGTNTYDSDDRLDFGLAEAVSKLSDVGQKNLNILSQTREASRWRYQTLTENLASVVESESFGEVLKLLGNGEENDQYTVLFSLMDSDKNELDIFLSGLTPEIANKYLEKPEYLKIEVIDMVTFYNDPIAQKVVDFAKQMRRIADLNSMELGDISAYTLLLIDFENDLENLQNMESESFLDMSVEFLSGIKEMDIGDLSQTAGNMLGVSRERESLDSDVVISGLEKLSSELRDVALDGAIKKIGLTLLDKEDEMKKVLEMTDDDWTVFVEKVYKSNREDFVGYVQKSETVSFSNEVWEFILDDDYVDLALICRQYEGSQDDKWTLIIDKGDRLKNGISRNVLGMIGEFEDYLPFWSFTLENIPDVLIVYFDRAPDSFFEKEETQKLVEFCLESKAHNCNILLDKYLLGKLSLEKDVVDALIDRIIIGGAVNNKFLTSVEGEESLIPEDQTKKDLCLAKVDSVIKNWKEEPDLATQYLSNLAGRGILGWEYGGQIGDMWEYYNENDNFDQEKIDVIENAFIHMLVSYDPGLKATFTDPKKMGRMKDFVLKQIFSFVKKEKGQKSLLELNNTIIGKLREIKRVFDSSDEGESSRRLIFLDLYNLEGCFDGELLEEIKSDDDVVAEEDNKLRSELISQKIRRQVERDIREILLYSGCEREAKYLLKNVDGMDGEEVAEILNLLKDVKETSEKRDKENRERYMSVVDIQQDVGETFLPVGSLTHGTQSQNLGIILDTGIFSGELLGSSGNADASGILGTDVSEVLADQDDFKKRFHGLSNYSSMNFGDVHLLMSDYKAGPNAENRNADAKAHMGPDHRLVRTGIPSSEITGVVVKDEKVIESVKKDLVIKGVFVPMMNKSGEMLFTPEEFDEMKIFYYDLSRLGYPTEVIDSVYEYHKDDSLSQKHRAVMDKAFAYASGGGEKFDWAVLVSFLRSNDLNRGSADWYQEGGTSFTDIMDFIKGRTKQKIREKSKRDIFSSIRRLNRDIIGSESQEDVEENQFIISFFQYQLPYTMFGKTFDELDEPEKEELYVEKKKYEKALAQLSLFATSPEIIAQAAHLFSEQKYDLMRKLWGEIWEEIGSEGDFDSGEVEEFKKLITPIVAGSGGRGELVLGSDLDYCLYVDDRGFSEEEKELKIKKIKHFVNNVLAEKINNILLRNRIRPDAGLANADRMPFTTFSTLKDFSINLQDRRQVVEPTEVLDGEPLFESDRWVAEEARDRLLVQNETAYLLPSYIEKDLELGEGKKSFVEEFEDLFVNVASGQMVERIKDSLQRSLIFKLDALLVNGLVDGSIPETMAKKIPSGIVDKISFLKDHKIFDDAEALVCRNLFAVGYKMRFLGELYSEEAKELSDTKKVKNVVFKVEDITYEERESLIDLLKKFKTDILYK